MDALDRLEATIRSRRGADPATSYVASLFAKGRPKIAQKVGEEATETVIAALVDPAKLVPEAADLVFHLLVLLASSGVSLDDVRAELDRREGLSGHDEKAARTTAPLSLSGIAADEPAAPGLPIRLD
jgi:phosphoribosyl-ATP pyrophosphohydrolase